MLIRTPLISVGLNMFTRQLEPELVQMAKEYPVVTLLGPRQAGKTTPVQKVFQQKPCVNLEAI